MHRHSRIAATRLLLLAATACSASAGTAATGATASPAAVPAPAAAPAPAGSTPRHTAADTRFMQGMIGHHAQALAMTALVPSRSERREIRLIAERIEVSQGDEIALMQTWLRDRGEVVPASGAEDEHAHHDMPAPSSPPAPGHATHDMRGTPAAHAAMPGMLSPAELAELAAARGPAFDRLFLERMIRHHEGALTMVAQLLATPGAAQSPDTYTFVSDVDSDQRNEIARMKALLAGMR